MTVPCFAALASVWLPFCSISAWLMLVKTVKADDGPEYKKRRIAKKSAGVAEPDGRACKLCKSKDSDQDICDGPGCPFAWGYNTIWKGVIVRNQGNICYYCTLSVNWIVPRPFYVLVFL